MSLLKVNSLQDLGADAVVTDGVIVSSALPTGSILQVVSTTKTDVFSMSSTTFADVTGLQLSITPSSTSSKILLLSSLSLTASNDGFAYVLFERDGTLLGRGDASASATRSISSVYSEPTYGGANWYGAPNLSLQYLDSPATTSSVEYSIQISAKTGTTAYVNRTGYDVGTVYYARTSSTFTLMEVAG